MNQTFDPRRFGRLLRLDLAGNQKNYLITTGLITGVMLLLMLPLLGARTFSDTLYTMHPLALVVCLLLGGSLFSSTAFAAYNQSTRAIAALMLPASRLEKFLVTFLIHLALMLLFLGIFWGLHFLIIDLANAGLPDNGFRYRYIPPRVARFFVYLYFLAQSVTFLGSIYFSKGAYIRSAIVLLLFATALFVFNLLLVRSWTGREFDLVFPFAEWSFFDGRRYQVEYPEPVLRLVWGFLAGVVLCLWSIAYVRLKEKEI